MTNPLFHDGELTVQALAGESAIAARNGRSLRTTILPGALPFLRQQEMVVLGSVDPSGRPWGSLLFGRQGFLAPEPEGESLGIRLSEVFRKTGDPLWGNLEYSSRLAMLAIETGTRRRVKMNGHATLAEHEIRLAVEQSVALCPKYIQRRHISMDEARRESAENVLEGVVPGASQLESIRKSAAMFVASTHASQGPDVSHRGGLPGFIRVISPSTLLVPDYPGNSMFNTFGNLVLNPVAGLVLVDFGRRRVLQMTGKAEILWGQTRNATETGGTGRLWHFHTEKWVETDLPAAVREEYLDDSPFNPPLPEDVAV